MCHTEVTFTFCNSLLRDVAGLGLELGYGFSQGQVTLSVSVKPMTDERKKISRFYRPILLEDFLDEISSKFYC